MRGKEAKWRKTAKKANGKEEQNEGKEVGAGGGFASAWYLRRHFLVDCQ